MAITKISTPELFDFSATNTALQLPTGDTASRPATPSTGEWRFNSQLKYVEYYDGGAWRQIDTESADTFTPSENFNTNTYFGTGATQTIDAKFNEAANFNGTSSKINTTYIQIGQVYSASFWAKNLSTGGSILRDTPAGGGSNTFMDIATGANGQIIIGGNAALDPGNTPSAGWNHYAVVLDGTNATIFTNGSQTATRTYTAKTGNNGTPVHMMSNGAYSAGFASGSLDQLRIYNAALTSSEVTNLWQNETTTTAATLDFPAGAGCIAAYQLDGNGNDISTNYNGTTTDIGYTGLEFAPDFVWLKPRSQADNHNLFDTIRGVQKQLISNNTSAESNQPNTLTAFNSDGFSIGPDNNINTSGQTYVAWCWKAGGAPTATNSAGAGNVPTAGSVKIDGVDLTTALAGTQAVKNISANTLAGFSIIKYQGTGSAGSIPHGLLDTPDFVIIKNLDGANKYWQVWAKGSGTVPANGIKRLYLNDQQGYDPSTSNVFYPDSTKINLNSGDGFFNSTDNFISYAFTSIPGYSFVGSYLGIGGTTGNVVNVGFEPSFILIKDSTNSGNWALINNKTAPTNPRNTWIRPNLPNSEFTNTVDSMNFSSTGFQVSGTATSDFINRSGATFIFLAIA